MEISCLRINKPDVHTCEHTHHNTSLVTGPQPLPSSVRAPHSVLAVMLSVRMETEMLPVRNTTSFI